MRLAVVGGGLFGCTAAIHAARQGHEVHLFERSDSLMRSASAVNQFRLHKGYHYPRSPETVRECKASLNSFLAWNSNAVIPPHLNSKRFYAIARKRSKVSAEQYLAFCASEDLPFTPVEPLWLNRKEVDLVGTVAECSIDPHALRHNIVRLLSMTSVRTHFRVTAQRSMRNEFDAIVIAAYAGINSAAKELGCKSERYQFEVIEKPVLKMPERFRDVSLVIMDGPFFSLDPYGTTGLHLMGHVHHAIHATNTGVAPGIPEHLAGLIDVGMVPEPKHSKVGEFISSAAKFLPSILDAEHVGSMFTVRAVLPDRDATDERPTLVERLDDKVVRIFSGKLGTCVMAAESALQMIGAEASVAA